MKRTVLGSGPESRWLSGIALIVILASGAASVAMAQTPLPLPKAKLVPVEPWRFTSPDMKTITRNSVELMSAGAADA